MITLPEPIKIFLTFLITQGIKSIANIFNKDISGKLSVIVAIVVGAVMFFIDGLLSLIPAEQVEIVAAGLAFIAMIVGAFGTHYTYKNIG